MAPIIRLSCRLCQNTKKKVIKMCSRGGRLRTFERSRQRSFFSLRQTNYDEVCTRFRITFHSHRCTGIRRGGTNRTLLAAFAAIFQHLSGSIHDSLTRHFRKCLAVLRLNFGENLSPTPAATECQRQPQRNHTHEKNAKCLSQAAQGRTDATQFQRAPGSRLFRGLRSAPFCPRPPNGCTSRPFFLTL